MSRMSQCSQLLIWLVLLVISCVLVSCTELTLELEDNARQCFYEDVKKGTKVTLEFQVSLRSSVMDL